MGGVSAFADIAVGIVAEVAGQQETHVTSTLCRIFREGEMEAVSVQSTKCEEDDSFDLPLKTQRRVNRKFSNFRQLVED
jgi:hypothetical protein